VVYEGLPALGSTPTAFRISLTLQRCETLIAIFQELAHQRVKRFRLTTYFTTSAATAWTAATTWTATAAAWTLSWAAWTWTLSRATWTRAARSETLACWTLRTFAHRTIDRFFDGQPDFAIVLDVQYFDCDFLTDREDFIDVFDVRIRHFTDVHQTCFSVWKFYERSEMRNPCNLTLYLASYFN
jgi:hypothetical protein